MGAAAARDGSGLRRSMRTAVGSSVPAGRAQCVCGEGIGHGLEWGYGHCWWVQARLLPVGLLFPVGLLLLKQQLLLLLLLQQRCQMRACTHL